MRITIKRWGNSAGMVIPNIVMKELNLQPGQSVEAGEQQPTDSDTHLQALLA